MDGLQAFMNRMEPRVWAQLNERMPCWLGNGNHAIFFSRWRKKCSVRAFSDQCFEFLLKNVQMTPKGMQQQAGKLILPLEHFEIDLTSHPIT